MNVIQLQTKLRSFALYKGDLDGDYGPLTQGGVRKALVAGVTTALTSADYAKASAMMPGVEILAIKTIERVESGPRDFDILFEGHRFSKATGHQFDATHPKISYPTWDKSKYPANQHDRDEQLVEAVGLNVDAGFASASYGKYQTLGENYAACGFLSPADMAFALCHDEQSQLLAFVNFIKSNATLLRALRDKDWPTVARLYNGTQYKLNNYDTKLDATYRALYRASR